MAFTAKSRAAPVVEPAAKRPAWRLAIFLALAAAAAAVLWMRPWETPDATRAIADPVPAPKAEVRPQATRETPRVVNDVATQRSDAEKRFVAQLLAAEVRSDLAGVALDAVTVEQVAAGHIAEAARDLERRAADGDAAANVVLSLLQECSGVISETLQELQTSEWRNAARDLPGERRARIDLALDARRAGAEAAAKSCTQADFDRAAIAERLQSAAAAGHEPSLRRLAEETTDVRARVRLWTSAAILGHVPAQLDLAQHYRREFLGAQRNGAQMKFWLDVAAKNSSAGKLMLAECQLNGCNGQQPDPQAGARLLREAAAAGDLEAIEKLSGERDNADATLEERVAWSDFRDRLNEAGCYGASEYPRVSIASWRTREENRAMSPYLQEQEQSLADQYWREHGAAARRALGCE